MNLIEVYMKSNPVAKTRLRARLAELKIAPWQERMLEQVMDHISEHGDSRHPYINYEPPLQYTRQQEEERRRFSRVERPSQRFFNVSGYNPQAVIRPNIGDIAFETNERRTLVYNGEKWESPSR